MHTFRTILLSLILFYLFGITQTVKAQILINEILTSNNGSITNLYDEDGDSPDYIELYNTTNSSIDLSGWRLMDEDNIWKFPAGVNIDANGYLTIWASEKDRTNPLHTNFKLDNKGEYLGLYDDQNNLIYDLDASYPPQYNHLSYGLNAVGQFNYFDSPTYNSPNGNGYLGKVANPTAVYGRGFYESSVIDTLKSNTVNATIRYTLDGTPVIGSSPIFSNSITINPSTNGIVTLRTKAFLSGHANSDEISFSYIFPDSMFDGNYGGGVSRLPVISIQTDDQTFPECVTIDNEKICDKESMIIDWVEKDSLGINKKGFSIYAGVNVFGETTANTYKRNFRVSFDAAYGEKYLEYPIFDTYPEGNPKPKEKFRKIELRGNYYENMNYGGETSLSEQWISSLRLELEDLSHHSVFVNLFVNGNYRGLYSLREKFDHNFYESYSGVDAKDINAFKADYREPWNYIETNGSSSNWVSMMDNALNGNQNTYQSYKNVISTNSILTQTVIESMLNGYGEKEFRMIGSDTNPDVPYKVIASDISDFFFNWEWEVGVPGYYDEDALLPFFYNWLDDPEFEQELFEFTAKHFCGSGAVTVNRSKDRMNEWKSVIDSVASTEAVFWYEDKNIAYTSSNIESRVANWEDAVDYDLNLLNDLPAMHLAWTNAGLFQACDLRPIVDTENQISEIGNSVSYFIEAIDPDGDAMTFSIISGLPPGLIINAQTGEITGTPTQLGTYEVKIKVEDTNNKWGYHTFTWEVINLNVPIGGELVINEIHYNPNDSILANGGIIRDENFEFIEVKNIGTANVVLQGKVFTKGIDLELSQAMIIPPSGFAVFANDSCWFNEKYGFFPDAEYSDRLDNGGEHLRLKGPYKEVLDSLSYVDGGEWPGTADKGYYSVALKLGGLDNNDPANWGIQSVFTTPRAENYFTDFGDHDYSGLVINEIHYNPHDSTDMTVSPPNVIDGKNFEFVELKNISAAPIVLDNVEFTRGITYSFPLGMTISPNEIIVLAEDKSSFEDRYGFPPFDKYDGKLDDEGETLWLQRIVDGLPIMLDALTYSSSLPWDEEANGGTDDYSLALVDATVNNNTHLNWTVQCNTLYTPGEENDISCFTGLDYTGLVINEFHYLPQEGNNYEFLELYNNSSGSINLEELRLSSAITYKFGNYSLGAGQYLILVRDSILFENTYGIVPHGQYVGGLSSNGETIILKDLFNQTIDIVAYGVSSPWNADPLQGVKSLALIDPNLDNNLAASWCIQQPDITPGTVNIIADSDNDSLIDCEDSCPFLDNNLIGTSCDDGDQCTTGETYDSTCNCSGGVIEDSDNDGVCNADDVCPGFDDMLIGQPCNDGDVCTTGESYDSNCECTGGVIQDADSDGVCDADDLCAGLDDNLIGQPCDDGNPCTTGETYDTNCACSGGIFQDADNDSVCDAADICPGFDDTLIGEPCDDGDLCTTGESYDSNCECSGGIFQDPDNDGICDDQCPNFDDNLIGQPCDDGDDCTTGEIYQSNCNCEGGILLDENNNGICDLDDSGCEVLALEDFEVDSGVWQSGGIDAVRMISPYSPEGDYSFRIRDNSGLSSSVSSTVFDYSNIGNLKVRFQYQAIDMEIDELFYLQISNDNGMTFTTIQTWIANTDFENNIVYAEEVDISSNQLSSTVIIRFQCDASINSDEVFLDNIILESCEECEDYVTDLGYEDIINDKSANIRIQSNGTVKSGNTVDFHAGESIELLADFLIETGATFHAFIEPCN